jgi:DNA polymerase-3 subunit delta'
MGFSEIWGQEPAVHTLQRALACGKVHHAYRFEGPGGVGKEKAAFAFAQALVCERGGLEACEACSACRRAVTLSEEEPRVPLHPDVVLVERGLYASSIAAAEATSISIEQIRRVVMARMGFPPHEGRALVFIVRAADELTVQAANAFLKTLEEPGAHTHFVLLTSRPNRMLDTVRSRTLAVRFGPLSDEIIERILTAHGLPADVAPLAEGSAALALELASEHGLARRQQFVEQALAAAKAPDLAAAIKLAESRPSERAELYAHLGYLAQQLAIQSRQSVEASPRQADLAAHRYGVVVEAMQEVEANAQPALVIEAMLARLRALYA